MLRQYWSKLDFIRTKHFVFWLAWVMGISFHIWFIVSETSVLELFEHRSENFEQKIEWKCLFFSHFALIGKLVKQLFCKSWYFRVKQSLSVQKIGKNHRFGKKINKMGQFSIFCQNLMKFHVFANFCMFRTHNRYANYLKCSEFCLHCVCYSLIFNEKPKNCISELLIFYQITRAGPTVRSIDNMHSGPRTW